MADIFHEIDEDLRRERFSRLWSRYGAYLIGLAVLIVLAVAGWRGYEWYRLQQAQQAGARFEAALLLATQGKTAEAETAFAALEKDAPAGYRTLSRFRAAIELSKTDAKAAIAEFDALAADAGVGRLMQDVAQVRAAMLLVDTAPLSEIESRVKPLDTPEGAFRHSARELIGLAQYKAGDYKAATDTFTAILNDGQSPPGLRRRAELMRTLASTQVAPAAAAAGTPAPAAAPAVQ
ncbi:tetratricopeptide repeat protein [Ancylobacter sp. WKF20]|uniref:tetratricopeptide repeat protein n=1 Tax=Ancylobacter sp. WKF20 TaxID=3039801 RepID=UPI00243445E9|nr:tetratricopeptide repeat protein [Ancylobacter sp. WKF20]WGD30728.1 tetratricopeptide repeat protein [Ancylobacter sp. WKF20]